MPVIIKNGSTIMQFIYFILILKLDCKVVELSK